MKPADTVTWDTDVETWQFPLDEKQKARLTDCRVPDSDDDTIAIVAIAPVDMGDPDLFLSRPLDVNDEEDLKFYVSNEDSFCIRFGTMPSDVFVNLPEHDGW